MKEIFLWIIGILVCYYCLSGQYYFLPRIQDSFCHILNLKYKTMALYYALILFLLPHLIYIGSSLCLSKYHCINPGNLKNLMYQYIFIYFCSIMTGLFHTFHIIFMFLLCSKQCYFRIRMTEFGIYSFASHFINSFLILGFLTIQFHCIVEIAMSVVLKLRRVFSLKVILSRKFLMDISFLIVGVFLSLGIYFILIASILIQIIFSNVL